MDHSTAPHPIFRDSPTSNTQVNVRVIGEPHQDRMRFFVYRDVLDELHFAASYHPDEVMVCLLIGQFGLEEHGPFIEVTGFEVLTELKPEAKLLDVLRASLDEVFSSDSDPSPLIGVETHSPVGFFIHRPNQGVLLEDEHVSVHLTLFNLPFQLIVLMDQPQDQLALYARPPHGPFFDASFHLVSRVDADSEQPQAAHEEE